MFSCLCRQFGTCRLVSVLGGMAMRWFCIMTLLGSQRPCLEFGLGLVELSCLCAKRAYNRYPLESLKTKQKQKIYAHILIHVYIHIKLCVSGRADAF